MHDGKLYMLLGLLSFSALGVFHKMADVKNCRPDAINMMLYAWSTIFTGTMVAFWTRQPLTPPLQVISIAIPFGISASIAILALQTGIRYGNIATSWLAINLSAGIPALASIVIYGEQLNIKKELALSLIVLSMALLWKDKVEAEKNK
jgi:drug/metabolite transporter (DMT)-like permease